MVGFEKVAIVGKKLRVCLVRTAVIYNGKLLRMKSFSYKYLVIVRSRVIQFKFNDIIILMIIISLVYICMTGN